MRRLQAIWCARSTLRCAVEDQNGYTLRQRTKPEKTVKYIRRNVYCKVESVRRALNGWMLPISPNAKYVLKTPFGCVHANRWHRNGTVLRAWEMWQVETDGTQSNHQTTYTYLRFYVWLPMHELCAICRWIHRIVSYVSKWRDTYYITFHMFCMALDARCSTCTYRFVIPKLPHIQIHPAAAVLVSAICARFHEPRCR